MLASETMPAFFVGINDPLNGNPFGTPFTPMIFTPHDAWSNQKSHQSESDGDNGQSRRASILRGPTVFNSKPINITAATVIPRSNPVISSSQMGPVLARNQITRRSLRSMPRTGTISP